VYTERDSQFGYRLLSGLPEVSISFPGIPPAISAVRRLIADVLSGCPRVDDVVLIGCEYATNAIRHSPSGLPGGAFIMRMWVRPGWVRLEVVDSGTGDWLLAPAGSAGPPPDEESGRGLIVVAAISDACGNVGCCAWAEIGWQVPSGRY
jgi:hypothetical protein